MKKYNSYRDLLENIGISFSSHIQYANEKLNNHLSCEGSCTVENQNEEPHTGFDIEIDGITFTIGVTSVEIIPEEKYEYFYWLMDTDLSGKHWVNVKDYLDKFTTVDMSNFDDISGVVDFKEPFSDYSIIGFIDKSCIDEMNIIIKDDEKIYRNN